MDTLPLSSHPSINNRTSDISQLLIEINNSSIKNKGTTNNSALVFEQYTESIKQTLILAQTVKEYTSNNCSPLGKDISTLMIEIILPLSEHIEQMKAMGSGIIAKGEITKSQETQMLFFIDKIETLTFKLTANVKLIASNNKEVFNSNINSKLISLEESIRNYISVTTVEILQKKEIVLDRGIYFNGGGDLISMLIDVYNINNKAILNDSKGWI